MNTQTPIFKLFSDVLNRNYIFGPRYYSQYCNSLRVPKKQPTHYDNFLLCPSNLHYFLIKISWLIIFQILDDRYTELVRVNEFNNNQALEQAFNVYTTKMDKHSQPSLVSIFIAPFIVKLLAGLPLFHTKSRRAAISEFMSKRRGEDFGDDEYYDRLLSVGFFNYN